MSSFYFQAMEFQDLFYSVEKEHNTDPWMKSNKKVDNYN